MVLPFLAGLAVSTAVALLAPYVGKKIAEATVDKKTKEVLYSPEVKQKIRQVRDEVRQKTPGFDIPGIGRKGEKDITTYDIPGSQLFYAKKEKELLNKTLPEKIHGVDKKKILNAFNKVEIGSGIGEALGTLGISAASERIGAKVTGTLIKKGASQAVKATSKNILKRTAQKIGKSATLKVMTGSAVGGLYEGATQTVVSGIARDQKITPGTVLIGGGIGMGTAAIGGAIIHKSYSLARKNPKFKPAAKTIDWVGQSLVDPYEKPGDIIASMLEKGSRKATVRTPVGKAFSFSPTITTTTSNTPETSTSKSKKAKTITITTTSNTPSNTPVNTPSNTPVNTPSNTPVTVPTFTPVNTPSNTPSNTPTNTPNDNPRSPVPNNTPSNTPSNTPVNTPSDTDTETPDNTNTPVPSNTPVNTPTPQPRNMPPLPFPMIPGKISNTQPIGIQKGGHLYLNEIELMKKTFRDLYYF